MTERRVSLAALPLSLRKASGFPSAFSRAFEATPRRHSRKSVLRLIGKAKPFRKESGKAAQTRLENGKSAVLITNKHSTGSERGYCGGTKKLAQAQFAEGCFADHPSLRANLTKPSLRPWLTPILRQCEIQSVR